MKRFAISLAASTCLLLGLGAIACSRGSGSDSLREPEKPEHAAEILKLSNPFERSIRWSSLLGSASPDALPTLREAVAASPLDIGDPEIVSFAMWWASFAPQDALTWTQSEWRAEPQIVVGAIFRVWGSSDPEPAFAAADGISDYHQDAAFDGVISGWHDSGKPGLVERVQSVPDDMKRQRITETLARRLVLGQGTDATLRWLDTIEDPGFRQTMTMRITSTAAAQGDAKKIAAWATPFVSSGPTGDVSGFPRRVGTRWILRDPPAALAWLQSLPEGRDRDDGVAESFRDWLRYTPGAALKWVLDSKLERWNEPAFDIYARSLSRTDPKAAAELAMRFADLNRRHTTVTVLARVWALKDAKAAHDWVAQADLPADVKERASMQLHPRQPRADQPGPLAP